MIVSEDSDKPEGSIGSNVEIPVPVDGTEEPQFEIPVSRSNQLDPERKSKEFRARHIQMMALGKLVLRGLHVSNRFRRRDWCWVVVPVGEGVVHWWTCFTLAWVFTHGDGDVFRFGIPLPAV